MTEQQARERKERVALQMLREGYSAVAIEERFGQGGLNLTRLERRHGIDLRARGHGLLRGLPVL